MTAPELTNPSERRGAGAARVVVVDDVKANVDLLYRLLTKVGLARVEGFVDPFAALESCVNNPPDLVLLDLHMPGLDGVGFLERFHRGIGSRHFVPVIVLTADVGAEARHQVLQAGAKDFLTKPFDTAEVVLRVRNTLESAYQYALMRRHAESLQQIVDTNHIRRDSDGERAERIAAAMEPHAMSIVYQPVVHLGSGRIVGAEALARFVGPPRRPPNEWFDEADEIGTLADLELVAVHHALRGMDQFPDGAFMSVNVSPTTVTAPNLEAMLAELPAARIVLELTERTRVDDYPRLNRRLEEFLARGGRIAVDDAGAGYAGLHHLVQLRPQVIKLDAALTKNIDTDRPRRALALSLVGFARDIGATIIAEGIETAAELDALRELGVAMGQGFYLARPQPLPLRLDPAYVRGGIAGDPDETPDLAAQEGLRGLMPKQRARRKDAKPQPVDP